MGIFERYLSIWVALGIIVGIALGKVLGDSISIITAWELYSVNIPVMILVWLMIFPMMVQIDFSSLTKMQENYKGLGLTVVVNWLIKPFTMALIAWLFFKVVFSNLLDDGLADEYLAGAILLGAAPCTAMVFVWSYLAKGNANYTLVQVAVNDLILLVAFIPLVRFLLGITNIEIPWGVLITSVVAFVVIPLLAGYLTNVNLRKLKGDDWFKTAFLPKLKPFSIAALLATLVLLFAFQGQQILDNPLHIVLIAVPLTIQTYLIFAIAWVSGKYLKLPFNICAPAGFIGASNFFELAVAVAIVLFGLNSGAALATVVGVLIEVPVMLSLVWFANKNKY
ncbi:MAG: ACR3 family arsenite efflux transporter [Luteibaculaceae bacterium]